jgi:hypothetical protein
MNTEVVVKRRICVAGAALSLCPLAFLAGSAAAAGTKAKSGHRAGPKIVCSAKTSIMIPAGQSSVSPPAQQGGEFGTVSCGKPLGGGVQRDSFTVPASGDTMAKYTLYFPTGTLHGTYDLTPQSSSLNFLATEWTGTMKVVGGTGAFKGATGTGTMVCRTLDGIHSACTDKLHVRGA